MTKLEQRDRDPDPLAVPPQYLNLYLKGNAAWPQKHFVHSLLIAKEALHDESLSMGFRDLLARHFSEFQIETVAKVMNKLHTQQSVQKVYDPGEILSAEHHVQPSEITVLWERAIVEGASWVGSFARLIPVFEPHMDPIPKLRDVFYKDRKEANLILDTLDSLLRDHPFETSVINGLLGQTLTYFGGSSFKHKAQIYRIAMARAHAKSVKNLTIDGRQMSKKEYTQEVADEMISLLTNNNPQFDWTKFNHSYK